MTSSTITATHDVVVTFPRHTSIGGGDPFTHEERSFRGRYQDGVVSAPRLEEGEEVWETVFLVEGRPELGDQPIRRAMVNHGTVAAHRGGRPVVIAKA